MEEKFVFLDRDGVINKDPGGWTEHGYVTKWEDFFFLPGVLEALGKFKKTGYRCVIISNQQGVGKGYFTREALEDVTGKMIREIRKSGGDIAGVYYCTHRTDEECSCKKPRPGLFLAARKELGIKDLSGKFFIGDTERDVEAGKSAGLMTITVLSGKSSEKDIAGWGNKPDYICADIKEAAELVLKEKKVI